MYYFTCGEVIHRQGNEIRWIFYAQQVTNELIAFIQHYARRYNNIYIFVSC